MMPLGTGPALQSLSPGGVASGPTEGSTPLHPAPLRPPPLTASLCDPSSLSLCWARPGGGDGLGATEDKRLPEFVYGERPGPACQQPFPMTGPIPEQGSPRAEENLPLASLGLCLSSLGKVGALPSGF